MRCLREAAHNLRLAGVRKIWVNGSFVTSKRDPSDIDGCWEYNDSLHQHVIDPVFLAMIPGTQ